MLVLARKVDEDVVLTMGSVEIVVKVLRISGSGSVGLGFDAPGSVNIMRREIIERGSERERAEILTNPGASFAGN